MKTIFFLLPTGITVRNFLSTGVIDQLLSRNGIRIVIFTFSKISFKQYEIENKNLIIETFIKRRFFTIANFLHVILRRRFYRTYETVSTRSLLQSPLYPKHHNRLLEILLSQPFPRSKKIYNWLKSFVDHLNINSSQILKYFDRYKPSLVVSTHPTSMDDVEFLHYARRLGVSTVGIVKSWDNLTTKGYIPIPANHYLVWNKVMKAEMIRMHQVTESQVTITGIPQFDQYADHTNIVERSDFFLKLGLDSKKKDCVLCNFSSNN